MNSQPPQYENLSASFDRNLGNITYGLYAGAVVFPVLALAAVIIDYIKRSEVRATLLESHFNWQIRTFWFMLLWSVIGALLCLIVVGWAVLAAAGIWYIYRVIKGWLRLSEGRAVP
jgi:uncharacterized membrane protein